MTTRHSSSDELPPPTPAEAAYLEVAESPEFIELRAKYRGWVIPVTIAAVMWYIFYVLLAAYAADFMGTKLIGNINVGLVLGFAQFITTFAITMSYVRYAGKVLDPRSAAIRASMEERGVL